jgi:ElaA protein
MALLTQDILLILNEADPMGLIKSGSPKDEYLPEAKAIEGRLATMSSIDDTRELVHGVFADWFSDELAGEPARYAELAERIYTLKSAQHANSFDSGNFIEWKLKTFDSLSPRELYAILQLRIEVFSIEQNCIYQDADNKDFEAFHLMAWRQEKLIAYTRLLPPFIAYDEASIGRVVTSPSARGTGIGRKLMEASMAAMHQLYGKIPIRIGAQFYLVKFYESFGFVKVGDPYLEDGIEHIHMLLQ